MNILYFKGNSPEVGSWQHAVTANRQLLAFLLLMFLAASCQRNQIALQTVKDLPGYFNAQLHFGKDIQSVQQLNAFLLVTGNIDTTDEVAPLNVAIITINHEKIILPRISESMANNTVMQEYTGSGYHLQLRYKRGELSDSVKYEGNVIISKDKLESSYTLSGEQGWH